MSNKKTFIIESDSPKFPSSLKNDEVTISEKNLSSKKHEVAISEKISTPIKNYERKIKSKTENHCDKEEELRKDRKNLNEKLKDEHKKCEETKYATIYKYFNVERKSTYKDLLNALMNYYKYEKEKNYEFILPFENFLDMFERDTNEYKNFKKQHVFEALCKILLMYDYDNGELGRNKEFYNSLENFIKNPLNSSNIRTREQIINEAINVSSESGVVDIFFKTEQTQTNKSNCEWICDCVEDEIIKTPLDNQEYILIQNKYYSKEKSDIKNYDVTKIFTKAQALYKSDIQPKIVLMVNNSQALNDKLMRSRDASKGLISSIYGVYEIDKWFNLLLYDLLISDDIDDYLRKKGTKDKTKPELGPRFHQMYFTKSTIKYFEEEGFKKFIWGAVPRSGKSYMIGDLISKRKNIKFNDIILILGAKTETESQFIKMFCEFSDYNDYGIIKTSVGKMDTIKNCSNLNVIKKRNIYIFSQDFFKNKLLNDNDFKSNFISSYSHLLKRGNTVDIYFDEVHKGGSTDKSENILNAINNAGVKIDIFIMVTATFAKPNIKYKTNFIDTKEPKILEWSYEDQQIMKNIKNETKMDMMINSRTGIERVIMSDIFTYYHDIYNNEFLDIISKQYERHPELVLVQPFEKIKNAEDKNFTIEKVFKSNLNCEACYKKQSLRELSDPARIFFDYGRVKKLLDLIAGNLDPNNSVYGYLKTLGAPDYANKHSELWFLPDDDLYITPDSCRHICDKETKPDISHNDDSIDKKQSNLPNIEPLTRGLAFALMKYPFFKEHYNVLIVHNTPIDFRNPENGTKISYEDLFNKNGISTTFNSKNLSETIKDFETLTYREGKNLIILTGAKLRLGISLPCVDIGFNFDSIQSVDLNYQTMFRVLTERYNKPKPFGYYIDFNKERFIKFLYQYNNTYSSAKNISNIKENVSTLQGLLLLFNINGIGLKKMNEKQELKLYNSLIEELKLDENGYKSYYSDFNNISNLFKKSLINVSITDLQKITKILDISYKPKKQKGIKKTLMEGEKIRPPVSKIEGDEDEEPDEEQGEEYEEDDNPNSVIINIISDILPRIIALIALFSNRDNYNCENLNDCLDNCLRKIDRLGSLCNCTIIQQSDILSCYLNSPFYNHKLYDLIKTIKDIINSTEHKQMFYTTNFIFNNIREAMGKENEPLIYKMTPEDIQKKIEEYLPVRQEKKDKNGEVFTPIELIEEMLGKLPPSVWKNPELKWLDPANGIGNFPMVVYKKLLEHLPDRYNGPNGNYSNENGKKKHIIEKMLYMVELDPANVKISRRIFGSNANISCADFLKEEKWKRDFGGLDKFDIIMGNPPFNPEKTEEDKRQGGHGGKILWDKFIKKSLEILNNNGFLCFITPSGWRKPENELYNIMTKENQLIYLHIYGEKDGQKLFDVSQRVDLYIIQKHSPTKNTEIIDELGNKIDLDVSKWNFIPNYEFKNIKKIMTREEDGIKIIYDTTYHTQKSHIKSKSSEKYKYPIVHSINQDGLVFWYTDDKTKGHFGVPKVLLNFNRHQYPVNDFDGKYGMSQITFGIPITSKKQGDDIVKAINTDKFKEIIKATKWGAFQTDWRMFKYFKPDFYKYFLKEEGKTLKRKLIIEDDSSNSVTIKRDAAKKIKSFVTKKHRERKNKKTKNSKSGGKRYTKKNNNKKSKTRKNRFIFF